jgi:hypothetical protein
MRRAVALLAAATLAALAGAVATLAFVARADFLGGAAAALARLALDHGALAAAAAGSPILAALLVGYAYMQRAVRRRAAAKGAAPAGAR